MKYKELRRLKDEGISYATIADWIGITRTAVSASVNKYDPDRDIPKRWDLRIREKLRMLEALINGSFS